MNIYKKALIYYDKQAWARTVLEGLVGKATEKKIKMYWEDKCIRHFECPSCEYEFGEDEVDRQIGYCPECGQSLDWSEFDGRRFK